MALYVDSAYVEDVARVCATFPVAGVTMNPSIMLAAVERGQHLADERVIREMLRLVSGIVFAQPSGGNEEALYADASRYLALAPQRVVPKLPMSTDGLRVARRLIAAGGRVSFTAVASLGQAYCAALAGAGWVIPYHSRLRRASVDPCERIARMADLVVRQGTGTRVLVASLKSAGDVADALLAGAHDITTTPDVIESLVTDGLTASALVQFEADRTRLDELARTF